MSVLRPVALPLRRSALIIVPALFVCVVAAPLPAQTLPDSTVVPALSDLSCRELMPVFYTQVPRYVYEDLPDPLYELVLYLDDRCEPGEPLGRIRILASIWDGNFTEAIYGYEVIDWLADRYDPAKSLAGGAPRADFDAFSVTFADQMLPHAEPGSLEEFFCLYYGGQTEAAWRLLQGDALADTWLRYYYDEKIDQLTGTEAPYTILGHWGLWRPGGGQEFVGSRHLVGGAIEQRWAPWFARLVLEVRLGRADEPYLAEHEGISGSSDRWNAFLIGAEAGLTVWRSGPHLVDFFVGLGYDAVVPFKDETFALAAANLSAGLGYRVYLNASRRWFAGVDGRFEWVADRNGDGTDLGGTAFSGRAGLGFSLGADPGPRLQALGRAPR